MRVGMRGKRWETIRSLVDVVRRTGDVLLAIVGEVVAPTTCVACDTQGAIGTVFCAECALSVVRARPPERGGADDWAVFAYGGSVATAIARLKYGQRSDLAVRLGEVMARAMEARVRAASGYDVVVPVPLHPLRLAERGFDQAALLARPVARRLGISWAPRALERTRATPPQASLERAARIENVIGAFRCRAGRAVEGKRVLLVDDVRTTGSTLRACAEALRDAGAARVSSFVLATRQLEG